MSERSSPKTNRDTPKDVSPADVQHFSTLPLAQSTLKDTSFSIFPISRTVQDTKNHHTLMAKTWNTAETIAHVLTLFKAQGSEPGEVRRFYTLGSGLNAHPDLLHGGVIAVILDSTFSTTAFIGLQQSFHDDRMTVATVQLNVKYQKPVQTPSSLLVSAKVKKIEDGGRKIWVEGSVKSGENGEVSHATAEGMWLRIKLPGEKL